MRIRKLLMLGGLGGLTTLCLALWWGAAQNASEVVNRKRAHPDPVVRTRVALAVPAPLTALQAPGWKEWKEFEAAPAPGPKVAPKKRRRFRHAGAAQELISSASRTAQRPQERKPQVSRLVAPEDAIRVGLRHKRAAFEYCYQQELKKQASFDGFVLLSVSLSANGRVTQAHVEEGTRRDARVGLCIAAQLRRLRLPPLTEEVDLLIPIRLQAKPT